jgi:hypothetical protein
MAKLSRRAAAQAARDKQKTHNRRKRKYTPVVFTEPESESLLTRKVVDSRGTWSTRTKPPHYTSFTTTSPRSREQSLASAQKPLIHRKGHVDSHYYPYEGNSVGGVLPFDQIPDVARRVVNEKYPPRWKAWQLAEDGFFD